MSCFTFPRFLYISACPGQVQRGASRCARQKQNPKPATFEKAAGWAGGDQDRNRKPVPERTDVCPTGKRSCPTSVPCLSNVFERYCDIHTVSLRGSPTSVPCICKRVRQLCHIFETLPYLYHFFLRQSNTCPTSLRGFTASVLWA